MRSMTLARSTPQDSRWAALHRDDDLPRALQSTDRLLHVVCGVTFIVWFHRCYRNTPARERRRSTAWAVWGWVIPIVSWWQPKRVANDMLRSRMGRFASLRGELTRAQLARAFRRATGVPFATVEAEAHSWVLSGGWRSPL